MATSDVPQLRGLDLRAERVRNGLTQAQVADRLGVNRTRITAVEAAWHPPAGIVRRYLAALAVETGR